VLDSGLAVVTEEMPESRSVAAGFFVGTGGRDEAPADAGASHFLEHLLFKGTPSRSAREIAVAIDRVGGEMNAYTAREYTSFYLRLLGEDLELGLDVLADIMTHPALRPAEVDAERQVIMEEILMHADEPADVAHERATAELFAGHPLGREVLGTPESVAGLGPAEIRRFFDHHYRPANLVFAAAGQVDHDAIVAGLLRRMGSASGGGRPVRERPGPAPTTLRIESRPSEQAHVVVAMVAPDRHDRRRYALDVLDHALGGGVSSRLFQEVRERRGLAYSVYSDRVAYSDAGILLVYAGTAPGRAREVLDLVAAELDRMAREGVSAEEVEVAKGHLRAALLLSLEDPGARMSRIGRSQLLHGEVLSAEELVGRIDAVTIEEVGALASEILSGPRATVVVGPFDPDDTSLRPRQDLLEAPE
jgi:predicted Zn-dependent peptidase